MANRRKVIMIVGACALAVLAVVVIVTAAFYLDLAGTWPPGLKPSCRMV